MLDGMRSAARWAAGLVVLADLEAPVSIVMGVDQHRAQIAAEWVDTVTGEILRARIVPADRAGVRTFLARFKGQGLEVALEATTG